MSHAPSPGDADEVGRSVDVHRMGSAVVLLRAVDVGVGDAARTTSSAVRSVSADRTDSSRRCRGRWRSAASRHIESPRAATCRTAVPSCPPHGHEESSSRGDHGAPCRSHASHDSPGAARLHSHFTPVAWRCTLTPAPPISPERQRPTRGLPIRQCGHGRRSAASGPRCRSAGSAASGPRCRQRRERSERAQVSERRERSERARVSERRGAH